MKTLLQQPPSTICPSLEAGDPTYNALIKVSDLLNRSDVFPSTSLPSTTTSSEPPTSISLSPTINQPKPPPPPTMLPPRVPPPRVHPPRVPPPKVTHKQEIITIPSSINLQKTLPSSSPSSIDSDLESSATVDDYIKNPPTQWTRSHGPPWSHRYPLRHRSNQQGTPFCHLASRQLLSQHLTHQLNAIYDSSGKKLTLSKLLNGSNKKVWNKALSNKIGRLTQGNDFGVKFTNCMTFIHHSQLPINRKVIYANFVCDHRPLKSEPWRVRLVVVGDKVEYYQDAGSPTTTILETKILVNSVISDCEKGARFMSLDLKDFFLCSTMPTLEYMSIHKKFIPPDIIQRYDLHHKFHNEHIYCQINKGMYGLPQATILAYEQLCAHLKTAGYISITGTSGMFKHVTRPTIFFLCVDDFGIKYFSKDDAKHLISTLRAKYDCSVDWSGTNFCELNYNWNYDEHFVDVSLPNYVQKVLQRLQHLPPTTPQYSPQHHIPIRYSTKGQRQYATQPDSSPLLSPQETKWIQSVVSTFLYYSKALDPTLATALNDIAMTQANPTQNTKQQFQRLMDYVYTYPSAYLRYHTSDMILHVDSDAAYLVLPYAKSRIAGFYHLTNHSSTKSPTFHNCPILVECKTLKHVVTSAAEAETSALFHNAKTAIPIRRILIALGHPQPPTPHQS